MINHQIEILEELCRLLVESSNIDYDTLSLTYTFNPQEGWSEVRIKQTKDNQNYSVNHFNSNKCEYLCTLLHDEMQNHTGGDWRKFILTLDKNHEVKTEFSYDIVSCLDDIVF